MEQYFLGERLYHSIQQVELLKRPCIMRQLRYICIYMCIYIRGKRQERKYIDGSHDILLYSPHTAGGRSVSQNGRMSNSRSSRGELCCHERDAYYARKSIWTVVL